jgi:hypothetical protein
VAARNFGDKGKLISSGAKSIARLNRRQQPLTCSFIGGRNFQFSNLFYRSVAAAAALDFYGLAHTHARAPSLAPGADALLRARHLNTSGVPRAQSQEQAALPKLCFSREHFRLQKPLLCFALSAKRGKAPRRPLRAPSVNSQKNVSFLVRARPATFHALATPQLSLFHFGEDGF